MLRQRLDKIVDVTAESIRDERMRPDRFGDREWIRDALNAIRKARSVLPSRPGDAAKWLLHVASAALGCVVRRLGWRFGCPATATCRPPTDANGDPIWPLPPPEKFSDTDRSELISRHTVPVLSALLEEIEHVLLGADTLLPLMPGGGGRGGRRPLVQRGYMIASLAKCWQSLGSRPTSGPNSEFIAFCAAVFEAIGWPTQGVQAAVPDALVILRHHPERVPE